MSKGKGSSGRTELGAEGTVVKSMLSKSVLESGATDIISSDLEKTT